MGRLRGNDHPNAKRLKSAYAAFAQGDLTALGDALVPEVRWHVPGDSLVAGDYVGRDAVYGLFARLGELTKGSLAHELHAVFADDAHGVALVTQRVTQDGTSRAFSVVHVFHLREGTITEFWEAHTDQYAYDKLLAGP
jgi:ketosteroid isomerase-like protein